MGEEEHVYQEFIINMCLHKDQGVLIRNLIGPCLCIFISQNSLSIIKGLFEATAILHDEVHASV